MLFEADQPKPGTGGHVTLFVIDKKIGEGAIPRTVPYAFTGTVKQVGFDLKPMTAEDQVVLHAQACQAGVGQGAGA